MEVGPRMIYRCKQCLSTNISPIGKNGKWMPPTFWRCRECGYEGRDFEKVQA